ncbi:MAG: hypothetical protein ACXACC_00055 [Promethearchaeota archaeon]
MKYCNPVSNPQITKRTIETSTTPSILYRRRDPPQIKNIIPITRPNKPIIDPNAIKNSIPAWNPSK